MIKNWKTLNSTLTLLLLRNIMIKETLLRTNPDPYPTRTNLKDPIINQGLKKKTFQENRNL